MSTLVLALKGHRHTNMFVNNADLQTNNISKSFNTFKTFFNLSSSFSYCCSFISNILFIYFIYFIFRPSKISHNRSLDGVLDDLHSKRSTEAGSLDLLEADASDSDGERFQGAKLPGMC